MGASELKFTNSSTGQAEFNFLSASSILISGELEQVKSENFQPTLGKWNSIFLLS